MSGCRECGIGTPPVPSGWHAPGCSLRIEAEAAITPLARAVTDNNLLLHAALRALVEAWDAFDVETEPGWIQVNAAVNAARAALAATDVRGALIEAFSDMIENPPLVTMTINGKPTEVIDNEGAVDAILAALAAKVVEG